jgi:hypothetical protein
MLKRIHENKTVLVIYIENKPTTDHEQGLGGKQSVQLKINQNYIWHFHYKGMCSPNR